MADVIVERGGDKSNSGVIVAIALLVIAGVYFLPGLLKGNNTSTVTPTPTTTGTGQ